MIKKKELIILKIIVEIRNKFFIYIYNTMINHLKFLIINYELKNIIFIKIFNNKNN
jgi:hypothetical protein